MFPSALSSAFMLLVASPGCSALTIDWALSSTDLSLVSQGEGTVSLLLPVRKNNATLVEEAFSAPVAWAEAGEPGEPSLPVRRDSYALVDTTPAVVTVTNALWTEVALGAGAALAPVQRVYRCGEAGAAATALNESVYAAASFERAPPAVTLSTPATLRDITYQVLSIAPVQYDHARRTVRVLTAATITLTGVAEASHPLAPRKVPAPFAELYRASFANSDAVDAGIEPTAAVTALLIHDAALAREAKTLAAHKQTVQGVPTTVVAVPEAGATSAALRKYLKKAYYEQGYTHVLLLGGIEAIPSPIGTQSNASCDNCYAFVTEDYAVDFFISRITGEAAAHPPGDRAREPLSSPAAAAAAAAVVLVAATAAAAAVPAAAATAAAVVPTAAAAAAAELAVAAAAAAAAEPAVAAAAAAAAEPAVAAAAAAEAVISTPGGAQAAQIDKIAHYETEKGAAPFVRTAWGIASNQTDAKKPSPTHPTDCTRIHTLRETLLGWNYEADTLECNPYATTWLGKREFVRALDRGHSLINYVGHGSGHSFVMTGFNVDDAHKLTNAYKNPIILDASCNNGDFGHTTGPFRPRHGKTPVMKCLAEALMEGNPDVPGSGVAATFSSAPSAMWVPPADMQTGSLAALTADKVSYLAPFYYAGVMYMLTQWPNKQGYYTIEGYNLFGDSLMKLNNLPIK